MKNSCFKIGVNIDQEAAFIVICHLYNQNDGYFDAEIGYCDTYGKRYFGAWTRVEVDGNVLFLHSVHRNFLLFDTIEEASHYISRYEALKWRKTNIEKIRTLYRRQKNENNDKSVNGYLQYDDFITYYTIGSICSHSLEDIKKAQLRIKDNTETAFTLLHESIDGFLKKYRLYKLRTRLIDIIIPSLIGIVTIIFTTLMLGKFTGIWGILLSTSPLYVPIIALVTIYCKYFIQSKKIKRQFYDM